MTDNRQKKRILIYGAYGFTGRLTTALAAAQAMDVILAGRNQQKLEVLGKQFSLPVRQIDLSNALQLQQALIDVATVLHMAGPFANTSEPMLNACLKTRTNYVDITGEISVFEALWARKEEIDRSGISVVPGSGFDVVPTDCLANYVAARQRESVSLTLAVRGLQTVSQGTLRTAIGIFADPVLCRRLGIIGPLTNPSTTYFMFEPDQVPEPYVPVTWGCVYRFPEHRHSQYYCVHQSF